MRAYYNEHDPKKAAWLRELIADGQITAGDVDERSIEHVQPEDLRGYTRCHFFAGIGVWDYALDLAGWGDEPAWTGSCPCPSFSAAGKGGGFDDPRHLWPAWYRLIRECSPSSIFGEQADDAIGYGWLDLVQTDLEAEAYAVGKAVLGACSVGAPHIRQRLFFAGARQCGCGCRTCNVCGPRIDGEFARFMADAEGRGQREHGSAPRHSGHIDERERIGGMGDTEGQRRGRRTHEQDGGRRECALGQAGAADILGDSRGEGLPLRERGIVPGSHRDDEGRATMQPSGSPWAGAFWLPCKDGKLRAVEPVPESLADGVADLLGFVRFPGGQIVDPRQERPRFSENVSVFHPLQVKARARRLRLHGYGDAIVAQVAAEFIRAFMEARNGSD